MSHVSDLVSRGALPADVAALVLVLAERGVPLVVAATDHDAATAVRRAFSSDIIAGQPARDAVAGGVVLARSLEDVLRVLGATPTGPQHVGEAHTHDSDVPDGARDLGVVLVLDGGRLAVAHYVRPVERDGAGHLQRRPPAVLGAWNEAAAAYDEYWWAFTDELATRAGLSRTELEDAVDAGRQRLAGPDSAPGAPDARH